MYVPSQFEETDRARLRQLVRRYSFATLVTAGRGEPFATHLPLLLETREDGQDVLLGHMARANPHWRQFEGEQEALAVFHGPHAYVSPSWYEPGPAVPTWNYIAVHAYGRPRSFEDTERLMALLRRSVDAYEANRPSPWPFELPEDYLARMVGAIVGFEMPLARIEGKLKLSQNRSVADQARVARALRNTGNPQDTEVAAWMDQLGD